MFRALSDCLDMQAGLDLYIGGTVLNTFALGIQRIKLVIIITVLLY